MRPMIASLMLTTLVSASAFAETRNLTPKEQYTIDSQRAASRYADDKKLCAEETASKRRMQCTRDAKTEYDATLASAKASLNAAGVAAPVSAPQSAAVCSDCAKVLSVNVSEKAGEGGAMGVIGGGVAGALLGHQVGGGRGKDLATLAGAAGGAYAGHKVEQKVRSTKVWSVHVLYDSGAKATYTFDHDPAMAAGDLVRKSGPSIVRR